MGAIKIMDGFSLFYLINNCLIVNSFIAPRWLGHYNKFSWLINNYYYLVVANLNSHSLLPIGIAMVNFFMKINFGVWVSFSINRYNKYTRMMDEQ